MIEEEKTEEIARLLALKAYERPDSARMEKNVQNTMQAVRVASSRPSLLLFPDKSFGWMFAQPRYGIAALFLMFLGLHLLRVPVQEEPAAPAIVELPGALDAEFLAGAGTNRVLMASPVLQIDSPVARSDYSSMILPVSYNQ
jgi:hypothetical protein